MRSKTKERGLGGYTDIRSAGGEGEQRRRFSGFSHDPSPSNCSDANGRGEIICIAFHSSNLLAPFCSKPGRATSVGQPASPPAGCMVPVAIATQPRPYYICVSRTWLTYTVPLYGLGIGQCLPFLFPFVFFYDHHCDFSDDAYSAWEGQPLLATNFFGGQNQRCPLPGHITHCVSGIV